ncbi:MAG TPA: glycine--tRNA ligase [Thermoplasmata archaeon]|nr:glycine--tRNA ligase [Thermoplasmata archaeon]
MKSDELFALLRRRGVLWPSAEIYGGAQGLYDYGPLGTALKRRVEDAWTAWFVGLSHDYYTIEAAEILPEAVVRASGHLENFTDPEVSCENCHAEFRADTVLEKVRPEGVDGLTNPEIAEIIRAKGLKCPNCGSKALSVPRSFNLMFGFDFGVSGHDRVYLRPETAQSSYLSFPRMWDVGRRALPLGIAIVGKAYRNEIAPRQILFRMRSFTQSELQIFFDPENFPVPFDRVREEPLPVVRAERRLRGSEEVEWIPAGELASAGGLPDFYVYHLVHSYRYYRDVLGFPGNRLRLFEKSEQERAFYNRIHFDLEAELESLGGFKEIGGVHYRGDYDLSRHGQGSGRDLSVTLTGGRSVLPHVLELTSGPDRTLWALADLQIAREGERTVWKLPAYLAPIAVGVFPLIEKAHAEYALRVADDLAAAGLSVQYDASSSIGRRYARMDEVGTPFCVTVDGETLADGPTRDTVTVRERDSKQQTRVAVHALAAHIHSALRFPRPPRS